MRAWAGAEERDNEALLRDVARGDDEALAVLYDRHAGWLTIRMTRRCGSPELVDHAVQDTFLAVWPEAGSYRGAGDVAAPKPKNSRVPASKSATAACGTSTPFGAPADPEV